MVDIVLSLVRTNEQAKKHGYFVMIEGSRVDHAGHANDPGTMAKEAIAFDESVAVVLDHLEQSPNTGMLSAANYGTGGLSLGRGPYVWFPTELQLQNMSPETMLEKLDSVIKGGDCAAGANGTCKASLLTSSNTVLSTYTNVTTVTDEEVAKLVTVITTAVDVTRGFYPIILELGHVISLRSGIGWTTRGYGCELVLQGSDPFRSYVQRCPPEHVLEQTNDDVLGLEQQQALSVSEAPRVYVTE